MNEYSAPEAANPRELIARKNAETNQTERASEAQTED